MHYLVKTGLLAGCLAAPVFSQAPPIAVAPGAPQAFEVPPVLQASLILPPELMRGSHYRVREMAPSDGFLTHFTIDSDYGVFECVGRRQLENRINEIDAIGKLMEVSKSDLFAEGLKRSVEAPIDAVKHIADDPSGAMKQVPKTVGHFFSKVGNSLSNASRKVGRQMKQADENDASAAEVAGATGKGIGNAAMSVAGFDKAKLDTARQLGVDPYSDNPRLQDEMEKVTWAFFAGGLPLRVGAAAISGGASAALTATKTVGLPEDVYDVTPGELALRDRESMVGMGVSEEVINEVFLNPALTVSLRHSIVSSLNKLPAVPTRASVIGVAVNLNERRQAAFLAEALVELVKRHQKTPYVDLKLAGRLPAGLTAEGVLEVSAPVDEVFWTQRVATFAEGIDPGVRMRRLLLGGSLSPASAAGLQANGWEVVVTGL